MSILSRMLQSLLLFIFLYYYTCAHNFLTYSLYSIFIIYAFIAVDRSQQSSLSDARDALINVAIDVLSAYKLSQSVASGGLLAPASLKLLPLHIIALLKCVSII